MPDSQPSPIHNRLLLALPAEDRRLVAPFFTVVPLERNQVLVEPEEPIEFSYFPEHGLASVLALSESGTGLEVFNLGSEGMSCVSVPLQMQRTPLRTVVQIPGSALRIRSGILQNIMRDVPALESLLLRYAHTVLVQTAQTALAAGRFTVHQRLSRWILMCHDRILGNDLPVTHEYLALILGVRRSGVTNALHVLEGEGIIRSRRSNLTVLDRDLLLAAAGASYGFAEAEYARVIGPRLAGDGEGRPLRHEPFLRLVE